MKPKPLNTEMHTYGEGKHGGAVSPRKGIPFGTSHYRFPEWAVDLQLLPAPKARDPLMGGFVAD